MRAECFERWNRYGFEPATYRSCAEQLAAENRSSAQMINQILLVMMAGCAVLSLTGIISRAFFPYYLFCLGYAVLVETRFRLPYHRDPKNFRAAGIDIGLSCGGLVLFGIAASAADPHQVATSYLVMQTLAAIFLGYRFFGLLQFELFSMLLFAASSALLKDPDVASGDILNAVSFFLVSAFLAYFFRREKIRSYLTANRYNRMAHVDSLTGILNHQHFFHEVDRILQESGEEDLVFAVFDIDRFKDINDRMGHQAGDTCIRAIAADMQWVLLGTARASCSDLIAALFPEGKQAHIDNPLSSCEDYYDLGGGRFERAEALSGRIGGDEFAALVGGENPMERLQQIEALIRTISLPDGSTLTCSVGCVKIRRGQSTQTAYRLADEALYRAKGNGRNQICTAGGTGEPDRG